MQRVKDLKLHKKRRICFNTVIFHKFNLHEYSLQHLILVCTVCQSTVPSLYNTPRFGYNTDMLWLPNFFNMEFYKEIIGE